MRFLFVILSFLSIHTLVYGQKTEQEIIEKINSEAMNLASMQCEFVQTKKVVLLNDRMVSKGKMFYKQSNKLRWEYTTPYTYVFVLNGSKISFGKNQQDVIDVNQSRVFKEIASIMMNSVVGKCLSDKKSFKTTIKVSNSEYIATLIPRTKEIKRLFNTIILHFDKQQSFVVRVELIEKNGDVTTIDLKNIKKNNPVNDQVFSIH